VNGETTNDFDLSIIANSLSPQTGSVGGGTLITISGKNFDATGSSTLVILGEYVNWFCDIVSITSTQIQCKTPPKHEQMNLDTPYKVQIITRLQDEAKVDSSCTFSYAYNLSP
jgi:hypothetical protein